MKRSILFFGGLLLAGFGSAQQPLSFSEIRTIVQANHPALKMLDAEATAMKEEAKGAYSWMPPEVGAGFFMTPYNPQKWKSMDNKPGMGSFMISGQQMFPNRKKQDADFAYLNAQATVALQRKDVVLNDLLYTARKSASEWQVLEKKLKVLDENERLLKFMMQSAEIRYKNGLGKISAYYKVKAALANVENMRVMINNEIVEKRIMLNTVMNRDVKTPIAIDTNIHWIEWNQGFFDSASLMQRRSDIQVLNRSIQVNNLEQEAELAALRPEFGLRYDHMTGWAKQPMQFTAMVMMKFPLAKWSSKMNKAKAESLVWQNEALRSQQQMIVNEATGLANVKFATLNARKQQLRLYDEQVLPALRRNFQTMQLAYEQNTEDLFPLFDAWEALNMTQLDYLDQLQQALVLQAELIKILELD